MRLRFRLGYQGVQSGSVLQFILFNIYINDTFEDDTTPCVCDLSLDIGATAIGWVFGAGSGFRAG